LLANVWCAQCRYEVTITNFSGSINSGNLLLVVKCAECHGDVARVIEGA
jgi:Zn finger protein HypA/HybF involved in hydrogenase expression